MTGLPWIRLDANIYSHDKILELFAERNGHHAFAVYICGIAWSGGHGTDGRISTRALPQIHGTPTVAALLVKHELWEPEGNEGWRIHNYAERQQLSEISIMRAESGRRGGLESQRRRRAQQPP